LHGLEPGMSAAQPSLLNTIRRSVAGMNRWVRFLLKGLALLLIAKTFELASSRATLDAAVTYQSAAVASLEKATPQSTYLLFKESLGIEVSSLDAKLASQKAATRCRPAAAAALSSFINEHPGIGEVFVAGNGTAFCIPETNQNQRLDTIDKSAIVPSFESESGLLTGLLAVGSGKCKPADDYAAAAMARCVGTSTGTVSGWGKQLFDQAGKSDFFYWGLALGSLAPGAALADVMVHNFAEWSPGVLFRWLLLAAGAAASFALVKKCGSFFGNNGSGNGSLAGAVLFILFAAAAIPSGTVIISTIGAFAAYCVASAALWLFGGFVKLVILPLVLTGGFFIQTAYGAVLEAGRHEIDSTVTKALDP
jgi:hypothetical protein